MSLQALIKDSANFDSLLINFGENPSIYPSIVDKFMRLAQIAKDKALLNEEESKLISMPNFKENITKFPDLYQIAIYYFNSEVVKNEKLEEKILKLNEELITLRRTKSMTIEKSPHISTNDVTQLINSKSVFKGVTPSTRILYDYDGRDVIQYKYSHYFNGKPMSLKSQTFGSLYFSRGENKIKLLPFGRCDLYRPNYFICRVYNDGKYMDANIVYEFTSKEIIDIINSRIEIMKFIENEDNYKYLFEEEVPNISKFEECKSNDTILYSRIMIDSSNFIPNLKLKKLWLNLIFDGDLSVGISSYDVTKNPIVSEYDPCKILFEYDGRKVETYEYNKMRFGGKSNFPSKIVDDDEKGMLLPFKRCDNSNPNIYECRIYFLRYASELNIESVKNPTPDDIRFFEYRGTHIKYEFTNEEVKKILNCRVNILNYVDSMKETSIGYLKMHRYESDYEDMTITNSDDPVDANDFNNNMKELSFDLTVLKYNDAIMSENLHLYRSGNNSAKLWLSKTFEGDLTIGVSNWNLHDVLPVATMIKPKPTHQVVAEVFHESTNQSLDSKTMIQNLLNIGKGIAEQVQNETTEKISLEYFLGEAEFLHQYIINNQIDKSEKIRLNSLEIQILTILDKKENISYYQQGEITNLRLFINKLKEYNNSLIPIGNVGRMVILPVSASNDSIIHDPMVVIKNANTEADKKKKGWGFF